MPDEELKHQLREAVILGKSRWQASKEFGVSPATAFRWTTDLPKRAKADKRLAPKEKERVRALVLSGLTKHEASKETGISYPYALWLTRDLPSSYGGNRCLSQKTLEILRKLFKEGYFMLGELDTTTVHYRTLAKNFSVKKVSFNGKTVIFLEDRKEEALMGFFRHVGNKVVHYNKMKELAGLFDLPLDAKMRQELFGRNDENKGKPMKMPISKKKPNDTLNHRIYDFIGRFLPSELLLFRANSLA